MTYLFICLVAQLAQLVDSSTSPTTTSSPPSPSSYLQPSHNHQHKVNYLDSSDSSSSSFQNVFNTFDSDDEANKLLFEDDDDNQLDDDDEEEDEDEDDEGDIGDLEEFIGNGGGIGSGEKEDERTRAAKIVHDFVHVGNFSFADLMNRSVIENGGFLIDGTDTSLGHYHSTPIRFRLISKFIICKR